VLSVERKGASHDVKQAERRVCQRRSLKITEMNVEKAVSTPEEVKKKFNAKVCWEIGER
jgi:hypothetical protein